MVRLSGSDGEECVAPPGRALRLAAVLYAVERGPFASGLVDKIAGLNDHKGALEVKWAETPTFGEMMSVSRAWEDVGLEQMSEHVHAGRMLATCDGGRWEVCKNAVFDLMAAEVPVGMAINPFRVL